MSASLAWPLCALMALLGASTFTLLGGSLRRMRSRDRLTVVVWWFGSACCVGSGLWGSWALGLSALTPPVSQQALQFQPQSLAAPAVAAAAVVTLQHFVARLGWPEVLRCAVHTTIFTAGWAAMFEIARRSPSSGTAASGSFGGLPTLAVSAALVAAALVAAGCATALWLVFGQRWRDAGRVLQRLWLCAATLGGCHAAALMLSLRALRLPQALTETIEALGGHAAIGAGTLMLVSGLAAVLVAEGMETARQRDILLSLQCDELQGYLFARPMAARLLTLWAMGEARAVPHTAPDAASGRDDFRDSLYSPDGPDAVIDVLQ